MDSTDDKDTNSAAEPDYREYGCLLVVVSAIGLFVLGFVLQLIVYELRPAQGDIPAFSKPLFNWLGLRPNYYLIDITFWFWWPILAAYLHTLFYYPKNRQFARVFAYRFAACCSVIVCYLSIIALMAALPHVVILLTDLQGPPSFIRIVPVISGILPLVVIIVGVYWRIRTKTAIRG